LHSHKSLLFIIKKFIHGFLLKLCLIPLFIINGQAFAGDHHISLETAKFEMVKESYFNQSVDFAELPDNKTVYLTYWGSSPKTEIYYGSKRLLITYKGDEIEQVHLHFGKQTKFLTFVIQNAPASYSAQYIEKYKGQVSVEIPEVYELSNIILALSDKFHHTRYKMHNKGVYYQEVINWFAQYKDHEIFQKLVDVDYYSFVENAPAYIFEGDNIKQSTVYSGFRAHNNIAPLLSLLTDFAKKSDFRSFYQQHQGYYFALGDSFQKGAQPHKIWQWLESEFPARYQSYKVFFSPLGAGNHSSRMFEHNGFKESVMFISGPNRYENQTDSSAIQFIKLTRTFFTEIDHTYVNPVSDHYINDINNAFGDLTFWYKGGGYNKPYLIFNEYMTWSIFSLYAKAHYSNDDYVFIKTYIENFMMNKRGFYQFKAFNDEIIRRYQGKLPEENITDLYLPMLAWIKQNQ